MKAINNQPFHVADFSDGWLPSAKYEKKTEAVSQRYVQISKALYIGKRFLAPLRHNMYDMSREILVMPLLSHARAIEKIARARA